MISGQGNVFSGAGKFTTRRALVPRPPTTPMSPQKVQVAMRNQAIAKQTSNTGTGSAANNNNNNQWNQGNSGNQGNMGRAQGRGNQGWGGNRRRNNGGMMSCPYHMLQDCPEVRPRYPMCISYDIRTFMGRPCRWCMFDMCDRTGTNPMEKMKDMAKFGMMNPNFMNQMFPMNNMNNMQMNPMQQAMYYDPNMLENMPSEMRHAFMFNQMNGGGGFWGNNQNQGGNNQGGNNQGGGQGGNHGGGVTPPPNSPRATVNPWAQSYFWHQVISK